MGVFLCCSDCVAASVEVGGGKGGVRDESEGFEMGRELGGKW